MILTIAKGYEMTHYTKEQITNIAADVLEIYGQKEYPIKIVALAEALGLSVYDSIFDRDDVAGMIKANEKKIYICKTDSALRQRFSIAHEIGHYVLHYKSGEHMNFDENKHISFRDSLSSLGFSIKEIEANYFAANILMPHTEVIRLYNDNLSIADMAKYFAVSPTAMGYRLNFLGLGNE